ncbi:MAG: hypothetical protein J7623_12305 [Chitinophaga sp.]|uniref:hypothetical protein n=1 Tax=Chitinophaga sp. TaxID=1869181 RepID=UPI001B0A0A3A|nr:hypothetical protein [Chitinophaga sp.]MBO9729409.1 hypothetical protein [Chitinophaga sp.]
MSSAQYSLHNFDVLLKGLQIQSHVYRYFFTPPSPEDAALLQEIATISMQFEANVSGVHPFEDFTIAIQKSRDSSEGGKQIFRS